MYSYYKNWQAISATRYRKLVVMPGKLQVPGECQLKCAKTALGKTSVTYVQASLQLIFDNSQRILKSRSRQFPGQLYAWALTSTIDKRLKGSAAGKRGVLQIVY